MYSLENLKTLALYTQHLVSNQPNLEIFDLIKDIGCLQIDTLQVVRRSHYIVLWSRLGYYNARDIDELLFPKNRNSAKLFEYWLHCASIIPLDFYKYRTNKRKFYIEEGNSWDKDWLNEKDNIALMNSILSFIRENGSVTTKSFNDSKEKHSGWWDWKPSKKALEQLYNQGELMIKGRPNFNRLYDVKNNVIPDSIDDKLISLDDEIIFWLELASKALGVCLPMQLADYTYIKRTTAKPYIESLIKDGTLVEIQCQLKDAKEHTLVVHKEKFPLLEKIKNKEIKASKTTFLSPFDNLFWAKKRDRLFWNFEQTLEAYKRKEKRKWGYFCLPILHKNDLIGRIDPKLDRKNNCMIINSLFLEENVSINDELIFNIKKTMQSFLDFHNVKRIVIQFSTSKKIKTELEKINIT